MTVLKPGMQGEQIKALQTNLIQLGFTLEADGIYGPATRAAVEDLQAIFGYDVDGVAGDGTQKLVQQQLGAGFSAASADAVRRGLEAQGKKEGPKLERVLNRGAEGPPVRYLQRRLAALGYAVQVDGKYGPATENAVRELQQAFGYNVDGVVGDATNFLLNQQLGLGYKAGSKPAQATPRA